MSSFFAKGLSQSDQEQTSNRSRFFEAHARDFGLSYSLTTLSAGSLDTDFSGPRAQTPACLGPHDQWAVALKMGPLCTMLGLWK